MGTHIHVDGDLALLLLRSAGLGVHLVDELRLHGSKKRLERVRNACMRKGMNSDSHPSFGYVCRILLLADRDRKNQEGKG